MVGTVNIEFEIATCKVSFEVFVGGPVGMALPVDCIGSVTLFLALLVTLVSFIVCAYTILKKPGETEMGVTTADETRITIK
ncbi:MAG TPA: hypothetical protein VGR54_03795 [Nitrosopumilaceae archaeon]|nr:hypothetical protein [Nitrosopumilaceae archaeon]